MKRILLCCWLLAGAMVALGQSLEQRLFDLPDVTFKRIEAPQGFSEAWELRVRQPVDHTDPSKGYFYQRVFLSHRGFDRPTVIVTEGYNRSHNRIYEPTELLQANQLDVEHRYFGASVPDSLDYTWLTLEQATADLHHIRELFGRIYSGKWVSTGISKGGQTTIFYRYFYPDDVDVSIPYVAPLNLEYEDTRIYDFLDTIGSDECRKKIYELQVRLLKNRDKVLPLLRWYALGAKLEFTYLTLEEAFEYAVLEYPFSFWQWGFSCEDIPDGKELEADLKHLMDVVGIAFYSDRDIEAYASHYYQAATQMGYYGYKTEPFARWLKALPVQPHPHAAFVPGKMKVTFDGTLVRKVYDWLAEHGNRFIYLYGATDTWSATRVPESDKVDSVWFILEGKDHRTCRIRNMTEEERSKLVETLERWLEVEIE